MCLGTEPCDHREVSKAQGPRCAHLLKIAGVEAKGMERGGKRGRDRGRVGRRGTSVSLEEGGQGH